MKTFEYSAQDVFGNSRQTEMISTPNAFGRNGWELVSVISISRTPPAYAHTEHGQRFLFKREARLVSPDPKES